MVTVIDYMLTLCFASTAMSMTVFNTASTWLHGDRTVDSKDEIV